MARQLRNYCTSMTDFVIPLALFALVTSITPGPNNLMLMASGANFGFRRTLPHMAGVALGFVLMAFLTGVGLARAFDALPWLHTSLTVVSAAYLLWLAWKIAHAAPPKGAETEGKPMTFLQAAAFQWVNPKAWAMALSAVTIYAPGDTVIAMAAVAAVFGAVNLPSVSLWCLLGVKLRALLTNRARLTVFNWTMAVLLIASMLPVLL